MRAAAAAAKTGSVHCVVKPLRELLSGSPFVIELAVRPPRRGATGAAKSTEHSTAALLPVLPKFVQFPQFISQLD